MRLIDADNLVFNGRQYNSSQMKAILDFVDAQPTAYDPDKVVKQLKEKTELAFQRYMNCQKNSPCYQRYQEQYLQRKMCLDIVKAGGTYGN